MDTPDHTTNLPLKRCTKCGIEYPATTEHFYLDRNKLASICKLCRRERSKQRRAEHPEYDREWQAKHPGYARECYAKNPEKYRERTRKRKLTHPEYAKEYRAKHPHYSRDYVQARRARQRELPSTFTPDDWQRALDYFGGRCAVCGRPPGLFHTIAQDHWIPLSKGGSYTPDNIIPLCHSKKDGTKSCNQTKLNRDAHEWLVATFGKRKAKRIERKIAMYFEFAHYGRGNGH